MARTKGKLSAKAATTGQKTAVVVGYGDGLPEALKGFDVVVAGSKHMDAAVPPGTTAVAAWNADGIPTDIGIPVYAWTGKPGVEELKLECSRGGDLLYAALVALHIGYDRVLVRESDEDEKFREGLARKADALKEKVRGTAGIVAEIFGDGATWLP